MSSFFKNLGKFVLSFAGGAAVGAIGAVTSGHTDTTSLITAAVSAGISAVTGHAVQSPLAPAAKK